jgi:hypothetical protein
VYDGCMNTESEKPSSGEAFTDYSFLEEDRHQTRIEGVEQKILIPEGEQEKVIKRLGEWFELMKDKFPTNGMYIEVDRFDADGKRLSSVEDAIRKLERDNEIDISQDVVEMYNSILKDSFSDPELTGKSMKILLERTGTNFTNKGDQGFHVDTMRVYWDDKGDRVGYDSRRSLGKYMVFINRPGTIVRAGKIDPKLSHSEATILGRNYSFTPDGQVVSADNKRNEGFSQLLPNKMYKVAVGDLLHSPPVHSDGLLLTAWFNE